MTDIVLVNPPLTLEERYGNLARVGTSLPPLGLTILAAVLRENNFDVKILDAAVLGLSQEEAVNQILQERPKYVGTTAVTVSIYHGAKLNQMLKERNPQVVTLVGGPHITALPEDTLERFPQFDVCVVGEGERTIVELLNVLERGDDLDKVAGIVFRKDGHIVKTPMRPFIQNLDELPMDAWDLLPQFPHAYKSSVHKYGRFPTTSLVTSRGCPGQCTFCDNSTFGRKVRGYSAQRMIATIKHLQEKYGIKDVMFNDDIFTALRKRLIEFCEGLIEEKLDFTWGCYSRCDTVNPKILKLMKISGCWRIAYGIETGSQEILDVLRKKETLEQMENAARWTREAGIRAKGFFMIGNPLETEKTLERSVQFMKKLDLDDFHATYLSPMPGSEIYQRAQEYGEFDNDWKKLSGWYPVFVPYGVTKEVMEEYRTRMLWGFYLRPRTIFSYMRNIRHWSDLRKIIIGGYTLITSSLTKNVYPSEEDVACDSTAQ